LNGPDTEVAPELTVFPVPFLGYSSRLNKYVVTGLAFIPLAAGGAAFRDVKILGGNDIVVKSTSLEISGGFSADIISEVLTVGVALRTTFASQSSEIPTPAPDGQSLLIAKSKSSGMNTSGVHAGIYYRPWKEMRLGLSYRPRITIETKGKASLFSPSPSGTDMEIPGSETEFSAIFSVPHRIKLGIAYSLLNDKLLISTDVKMLMYKAASKETITILRTPKGDVAQVTPLNWRNNIGLGIGVEYAIHPLVSVRAGYGVTSSSVPSEVHNAFTPSPQASRTFDAGAGLHLGRFDVDLGALFGIGGGYLVPPNAFRGEYSSQSLVMGLSGTYHN
jgi:long-subunit fatty acid transport protein